MKNDSLFSLFIAFLKLGLFTIGGGLAMIPQMRQIAVEDHGWLTEEEVVDCIAVSQSLPGVVAINMATFIGRKRRGIAGALAATTGVVLPSVVIIILAVLLLGTVGDNPYVAGAFLGVKAAICGLILVTAIRMGKQILHSAFDWALMIGALAAIGLFGVNAVWVILGAAACGILRAVTRGEPGEGPGPGREEER